MNDTTDIGRPSRAMVWVLAARPATLTAALAPIVVAASVAYFSVGLTAMRLGALIAAALGAVFIQVGTNLANDVFDYEKGADTTERLGPVRVTQSGLLSPREVRIGMVFSFALATVCGLFLTVVCGWPIVLVGIASIASGVAYTGGPFPLGYNGLGDVFVFLFFGFVAVVTTTWVAAATVPSPAWLAALPVGALSTAVLVVNNLRDRETDAVAKKRTLVVRLGRRFGVIEYFSLCALSIVVPVAMAFALRLPWLLLPSLTLPTLYALSRRVASEHRRALNPLLAATARALFVHSVLFSAGFFLSASHR